METRTPPQDPEAEEAVLGAMILEPKAIEIAISLVAEADFYSERNRKLFRTIYELWESKKAVDVYTLKDELTRSGDFEAVGGLPTITKIMDRVLTYANIEYHCGIVKEKAIGRAVIGYGTQLLADAYSGSMTGNELLARVKVTGNQTINRILERLEFNDNTALAIEELVEEIEQIAEGKKERFISSGMANIDYHLGGFERQKAILITGEPGTGKSSLVQSCLLAMAEQGIPTALASLESPRQSALVRLACTKARVNYRDILSHDKTLNTTDRRERVIKELRLLKEYPIYIVGQSEVGRTFDRFAMWVRRAKEKHGIKCVFVDSFAKFQKPKIGDGGEAAVAELVNDLTSLAQEIDLPIVTIHHSSRPDASGRRNPKGSGSFEFDFRCWIDLTCEPDNRSVVTGRILKNSDGPAFIDMQFQRDGFRFRPFSEQSKSNEEDSQSEVPRRHKWNQA